MASNEPPREAVKQPDGSWVLQMEDGSSKRWTRRPDGTWRKPEHVRAGWVGELEQQKYVSRGTALEDQRQAQMQAQLGRIPGAPPEAASAEGNKSAASKKNERKKEKRREKAEEEEAARIDRPDGRVEVEASEGRGGADMTDAVKNEKNIRKKLRQIEELEAKEQNGEALNEDQLAKVSNKANLEAELKAVLAGEPVPAQASAPAAAPQQSAASKAASASADPAPAGYTASSAPAPPVPEPAAAAASKNRKAIEKKLRQIAEIEEKERNGETMNDDQRAKLASKKQLQADLKTAV
jgi:hypothetical protein